MIRYRQGNALIQLFSVFVAFAAVASTGSATAQEGAYWIWCSEHSQEQVPNVSCHFRKEVTCRNPESARIEVAADDSFELYVNGRQVGTSNVNGRVFEFDIAAMMIRGRNIVAVKVSNVRGSTAGLAARIWVKERNADWTLHVSDGSWKCNLRPFPLWNTSFYNDNLWTAVQLIRPWEGADAGSKNVAATSASSKKSPEVPAAKNVSPASSGSTGSNISLSDSDAATQRVADATELGAGNGVPGELIPKTTQSGLPGTRDELKIEPQAASRGGETAANPRFKISPEFAVEELASPAKTGSLLAMTFNEFGHIVASRDDGPLLLLHDSDKDGLADRVREYCTLVKGCQGILALNGDVFVTGDGPDGSGLYQLSDKDRDGKLETHKLLFKFTGGIGEHGPHGICLGPDGWIYCIVGNHAAPEMEYSPKSPHRNWYEGDLVGPRYEDPGGHAVGVKAPGGVVIRARVNGEEVECVAGGLRNAYDLAFNSLGDLFVHDSDMEADIGMSWYRPTQLYLITPGGEYGWRSGWATWPEYFVDGLPSIHKTGRGSPTAAVFYNHVMFPKRYHDSAFLGDWSEGRILNVRLKRNGASYSAESEVFLEGEPLNITDLDVGPDGGLYFCTGGRGTGGGIYRVRWKGSVPPAVKDFGEGITSAIRQPQFQSAWSRQKVALVKQQLGDKWNTHVAGVARSTSNPANYRVRALDLMQLLGPAPSSAFLGKLAADADVTVRAKAAELLALNADEDGLAKLYDLLSDKDLTVQRKACEALARTDSSPPLDKVFQLLKSEDRFVATAARRLLERQPIADWKDRVLSDKDHRVYIHGSLALMSVQPSKEISLEVLSRFEEILSDFISDPNFVDILRVVQVALHVGEVLPDDVADLREQLSEEFPAKHPLINRELIRVLVFLQADGPMDRYLAHLDSVSPETERMHLALHLRFLQAGWTDEGRLKVIEFLEKHRQKKNSGSAFPLYVSFVSRDIGKQVSAEQTRLILSRGDAWPGAALGALYTLPPELDPELRQILRDVDQKILDHTDDPSMRLKVGIAAILSRAADEEAFAYLRQVWERDPERRVAVAMGLAQSPDGDNWDYLVKSIPILDGPVSREIMIRLLNVGVKPDDPEYYRQVIIRGLSLKENGAQDAIALLEHWTGDSKAADSDDWQTKLAAWQQWFSEEYPDRPEATLPADSESSKWKLQEILKFLSSTDALRASHERGAKVFVKAQCAKCHRFGGTGERLGPDLTSVRKRFQRKEVVEAILHPSQVVSDQYASKTVVLNNGRKHTGIVTKSSGDETIVLTSSGEKVTIRDDDIEEVIPSRTSAMPSGLLDPLSLSEIADLFAYLEVLPSSSLARKTNAESGTRK